MTEEERRALGRTRRLAFQNTAVGLPAERIMAELRLSQVELDRALRFVGKKITEHRFLRRQPPIGCADVREIRFNRLPLLAALAKIGDLDLSTDLILSRITVQSMDHPEMVEGAKHRMQEASRP